MKKLIAILALTAAGMIAAEMPKSVIHVITIQWKEGTTEDQIKKAVDGAQTVAKQYPGVTRMWVKPLKVQGKGYTHAIVMEFKDEQALKDYAGSAAQKAWYEIYLPIRGESTTHDITN